MAEELLRVNRISKAFAGVRALEDVSFTIERGEIRCLVGENGSGKSTLIKIIAGVYSPDEGEIFINGKQFKRLHPIDSIREGIQIIYQDFSLFPNLTVAENIALNYELARNTRFVNWKEVRSIATAALDKINIKMDLDARVEQMSVADKQLIAISRALLQNAQLIIMDEPTTALTHREVKSLFSVIKNLQNGGISTLFVSHKLNEVLEISDRTMILRNGKKVVDADASDLNKAKLVYHMTGRQQIEEASYEFVRDPEDGKSLLKVENLSSAGNFADISFELLPGEIVGITGLLGSGRTELALALFGVYPADSGMILVNGKPARIAGIQDAIHNGIGYVPEDRLTEGLFLERSIGQNVIVRTLDQLAGRTRLLDSRRMAEQIQTWVKDLSIKTSSAALPAKSLSGGNQQRVVLAKWLASSPRILILNGPTVGVDVGSKRELHEIIKSLARKGIGVLIMSDDIPELLQICNRILLMRRGRLVEEFLAGSVTENELTLKLTEA
jgi:simple sugar transport system ATP-binding protein